MHLLAYIPFIHPLNALQPWWYLLLVPFVFGVSVIYKAYRLPTLASFWRHVGVMTVQIVLIIVSLSVLLALVIQVLVPLIPVT